MKTAAKIGITVGVVMVLVIIIVAEMSVRNNNNEIANKASANIEDARQKLQQEEAIVNQHMFEYKKEWFPSSELTNQMNQEIAQYNAHRDSLNKAVDEYNQQYARK